MKRFTLIMVLCGLVIAWRFAGSPTLRSPFFRKATTDGVVRRPSSLAITTGSFASITATQLFVVPRSMPIIFPIFLFIPFRLVFKFLRVFMLNDYAMQRKGEKLADEIGCPLQVADLTKFPIQ